MTEIVMGVLPADHPLVAPLRSTGSIAGEHAFDALAAAGKPIWLTWTDPSPSGTHGVPPRPGYLSDVAWFQQQGRDPQVGEQGGTQFKTARRHELLLDDGRTLSVPIWRQGRRDTPHDPICHDATCADCGTGNYWLLPQYVHPPFDRGLAAPDSTERLHPDEKVMIALGNRTVRLTDYARYVRGMTGRPRPRLIGEVLEVIERERADYLTVSWNDRSIEKFVPPKYVGRP